MINSHINTSYFSIAEYFFFWCLICFSLSQLRTSTDMFSIGSNSECSIINYSHMYNIHFCSPQLQILPFHKFGFTNYTMSFISLFKIYLVYINIATLLFCLFTFDCDFIVCFHLNLCIFLHIIHILFISGLQLQLVLQPLSLNGKFWYLAFNIMTTIGTLIPLVLQQVIIPHFLSTCTISQFCYFQRSFIFPS